MSVGKILILYFQVLTMKLFFSALFTFAVMLSVLAEGIVLTADGIAETGSHNELIKKNGIYANLYKMYSVS